MSSAPQDSGDIDGALGAYERAPAIMLACEGDEMVLASANGAARTALGDRCEFGRPVREISPDVVDQLTGAFDDDVLRTVLAGGRSVTRPGCRVEVHLHGRGPVELFFDVTVSPWYADDGSVRGVLAHGVDVTEKTRARLSQSAGVLRDVITVQDALLPEWLPVLPGVELAARYLSASNGGVAGGDWYDALEVGHGRVAMVVGDVVGHGIAAAATMGQLRAVLRDRLNGGAGLTETMRALDTFARQVPEARATTVCVVVLDTTTGRLEYCTAGHPPPLVVRPGTHGSRYLGHSGAAPLATTGEMGIAEDHLDCGDLVLLYTDGIVERPGRHHASSTVELGQVVLEAATSPGLSGPADHVCDEVLQLTTDSRGYADDVVLLVAEVTEPLAPLHLDLPADDTAVPLALEALDAWLESVRVRDLDHTVVQHAADELVSNVVDHAYGHGAEPSHPRRLAVDASLLGSGEVSMRVSDAGRWLEPGAGSDGRGLRIVRGMVDQLSVSGADQGTTATVRHRLSRPAPMLTGSDLWSGRRAQQAEAENAFTLTREGARLRLTGALDPVHMDDLRGALAEASGPGPLVLDLAGVSRLPSTAVQALFAEQDGAEQRDQELLLFAPAGTLAQQVLELARLPHVLTDPDS